MPADQKKAISVAGRLFRNVFFFYFFVAFFLTSLHVCFEYLNARDRLKAQIGILAESFQQSLSRSIWNLDEEQIKLILTGILEQPIVDGVRVVIQSEAGDQEVIEQGLVVDDAALANRQTKIFASEGIGEKPFIHEFSVSYYLANGEVIPDIAKIAFFTRANAVFNDVKRGLMVIVINALLKTLALWFIFRFFVKMLISNPLRRLTHMISNFDFKAHREGVAPTKEKEGDEISALSTTFDELARRISDYARENQELTDHLNALNQELESKVEERTREIKNMRSRLVDAAHKSGMADLAREILHNVGNVLSSLKVSVQIIERSLPANQVRQIRDVSSMLGENSQGEKQKNISDFIVRSATYAEERHSDINREITNLSRYIDHIVNILSIKTMFGPPLHTLELIRIADLIEDAIQISGIDVPSVGISVIRGYNSSISCLVDIHAILQIMTNLLVNAKYAVKTNPKIAGQITIQVDEDRNDTIKISVTDNGIGIPRSDIGRVFQSGFSTKDGGSGLGLHNSANAAKSIGGSLSCFSEGGGRGATFVLCFPKKVDRVA